MTHVDQAELDLIGTRLAVTEEEFLTSLQGAVEAQLGAGHRLTVDSVVIESSPQGVSAGTAGIWRIHGAAHTPDTALGTTEFSFLLKGFKVDPTAAHADLWGAAVGPQSHPFYWRREIEAYASGLLARPGVGGLRAPDYFGSLSGENSQHALREGIFLEEVRGQSGEETSLSDFREIAKQLGEMQGHFLLRHLAHQELDQDWLAQGYAREYVSRVGTMMTAPGVLQAWDSAETWNNPLLQEFRAPRPDRGGMSLADATMDLWEHRELFLAAVETMPTQTLSHNDLWQGQFKIAADGTVVLDLASLGHAPLGMDLGKLGVELASREVLSPAAWDKLEAELFNSYMTGLAEAGVRADSPLVQDLVAMGRAVGLSAMESYRLKVDYVSLLGGDPRAEVIMQQWNLPASDMFHFYAQRSDRLLDRADQAVAFIEKYQPMLTGERPLALADVATPLAVESLRAEKGAEAQKPGLSGSAQQPTGPARAQPHVGVAGVPGSVGEAARKGADPSSFRPL